MVCIRTPRLHPNPLLALSNHVLSELAQAAQPKGLSASTRHTPHVDILTMASTTPLSLSCHDLLFNLSTNRTRS